MAKFKDLIQHDLFTRYSQDKIVRYYDWITENSWVKDEFEKLALKVHRTGRRKYSGDMIVQVLRWERDMQTTGDEFKISNDFRSMLIRHFIVEHPNMRTFFSLKDS